MLGFFRINDPYRLLILFLAVVLLRLPYLLGSEPLVYEINWLLIGENLNSGKILYKDIITPIAPLAAWTYQLIVFLFGKSILALQVLSILLVTYQFSLFNNIMLRNKAYHENSYIPALVYALMMSIFYDFFTLSPALISLTFILLVLDNIYLRIENKLQDVTILKTGIFMGLAVLFYSPSLLFFVATLLSFALLTGLVLRRYLLFIYGFIFSILTVLIYFYWQNALSALFLQWILFNTLHSSIPLMDLQSTLVIATFPTVIFLFALYKTFTAARFTNYQVRVQQVMFIMFLAGLGSWWVSEQQVPFELIVLVPSLAFFITHLILQFKRRLRAEIFTITFTALLLFITYTVYYQNSVIAKLGDFQQLKSTKTIYEEIIKGKSVMILGGSVDMYQSVGTIATRFYHPSLSQVILDEMTEKEQLVAFFDDIHKYEPEVIMDFSGLFKKHKNKAIDIDGFYKQKSNILYVRNSSVSTD